MNKKKIVFFVLALLFIVIAFFFIRSFFSNSKKEVNVHNKAKGPTILSDIIKTESLWISKNVVYMTPFYDIELKDSNSSLVSKLYLKLAVKVSSETAKKKFYANRIKLEKEILFFLHNKEVSKLYELDDLMIFKDELTKIINNILGLGVINRLYFTELYIYRHIK